MERVSQEARAGAQNKWQDTREFQNMQRYIKMQRAWLTYIDTQKHKENMQNEQALYDPSLKTKLTYITVVH